MLLAMFGQSCHPGCGTRFGLGVFNCSWLHARLSNFLHLMVAVDGSLATVCQKCGPYWL